MGAIAGIRSKRDGFSLIETAIGILIAGILISPLIGAFNIYLKNRQIATTTGNIGLVKTALQRYVVLNGCYPLPADPGVTTANPRFGQEVVMRTSCATLTGAQQLGLPLCLGNDRVMCRTATGTGGASVYIGDVPFATLGLPHSYVIDGFGSKFTYAVTANLTGGITFADNGGKIIVHDRSGGNTTNGVATTGNIHYIVISHGRDGVGGFSLEGVLPARCGAVASAADNEDCNNDATFSDNSGLNGIGASAKYQRLEYSAAGAAHYDDYVGWTVTTAADLWVRQPASANILNNNTGFVRIGSTGTLPPNAKADVRGDVKADTLWTNNLCGSGGCAAPGSTTGLVNAWAPKVFTPAVVGGTPSPNDAQKPGGGIDCTGASMTGIKDADEICSTAARVQAGLLSAIRCPTGYAPCGITPGSPATLRCRVPGGVCN